MNRMAGWRAGAAFVLAAALGGCGMLEPREPAKPPVNLSGYNAAFKQGYSDGCASVGGRRRRDESRYERDADYSMGWNDGYSVCGKRR